MGVLSTLVVLGLVRMEDFTVIMAEVTVMELKGEGMRASRFAQRLADLLD